LRPRVKQIGGSLWRLRHWFPVTPLGLVVALVAGWISISFGTREVDYVLRAGGLAAIGVVALATLAVVVATLRVRLGVRRSIGPVPPLELETGLTASSGHSFPSLSRWPLVRVELSWEAPAEVDVTLKMRGGRAEELVRPLLRGEATLVRRRFLIEDIFGFARLGAVVTRTPEKLRFSPPKAKVTAHVIRRFIGGDALSHPEGPAEGELLEMRRYAYGDPLRHVIWKAFARTRKLLVRTHERAITPRPSAVAYMVSGPGDEPAAGAARFFVEEGMLGREFLFCADGADLPTNDPEEAVDQIVLSSRHREQGAEGLGLFLGRLTSKQLEACLLFVPPLPGPWLARVEALVNKIPKARVITAVDAAIASEQPGWMRRLLFRDTRGEQRSCRGLAKVVRRLGGRGFEIHVLHRPSGELFGRAQLEALVAGEEPV
jgi:hypothetical protein